MMDAGAQRGKAMRSGYILTALATAASLFASPAAAGTLEELVKEEEGIELGVCNLTPRPNVAGKEIHVVIPARFPSPGIWITRSVLFVGVDESKTVMGVAEAKALHDLSPREVISVSCNRNRITIRQSNRMAPATVSYVWTGKELKRAGAGK
jgi:hypothetical protein